MALQHAVEDQVVQRNRRLQRIADDVVEIEAGEAPGVREAVGVDHDQHAEFLGLLPERREGGIGQLAAGDIGQDLHALEAELADAALELLGRLVAVGHRHAAEALEAVGLLGDELGDAVVDDPRRLHRDVEGKRVVALRRRRLDHLHVEAHGVEIGKPLLEAAAGDDVGLLLLAERARGGIGESHQRTCRGCKMGLHELSRTRHTDVGMQVDGAALGPDLAPRPTMRARCRRLVLAPLRHVFLLFVPPCHPGRARQRASRDPGRQTPGLVAWVPDISLTRNSEMTTGVANSYRGRWAMCQSTPDGSKM